MKMLKLLIMVSMVLVWGAIALAGDYHSGSSLLCSDCHIMHASQSHGYNADGTGDIPPYDTSSAHEFLLRNSVTELCLGCHDGQAGIADVMHTNVNSDVRAAGALNMPGSGTAASGHSMGSTDVAPGGTWANGDGFTCTDCHQQHGYNPVGDPYRNLHYAPGDWAGAALLVDYATGTNDPLVDVFQTVATGANHYAWDNVAFNEPDITGSAYADYCKACHTDFHGVSGSAEMGGASGTNWLRHPNADVEIGGVGGGHSSAAVYNGHTNQVKVMSASGMWDGSNADLTPSCMSCHKAHGNQNAFGLIFMSGSGATVSEEGDGGSGASALCGQCHVQ